MKVRRGLFSYLPDLTDDEIRAQVQYAIDNGWGIGVEYTYDAHPLNYYWEMWESPMFRVDSPDAIMDQIQACREAHPDAYVTFKAFVSTRHRQGVMMDVIVNRPEEETEFIIERETRDRRDQGYTIKPVENSRV